ncbi:beta-1,4-N-acetylgalactosaminyltransferase 3-like [Nelusetta ayraudi]|uniref:beta-1,4-N-acetylgalactosaminyltransferase 3-like n=1 Tax=Nelusetta ayraudi TaxID=303726 RepID=UPI003F728989
MKREDPRETFHKVRSISSIFLDGVLPKCLYKPTYTMKGQTVKRYKGIHLVHLTYIYPNDYTRLTQVEKQDSCFDTEKLPLIRDPAQTNDTNFDLQEQISDRIDFQCTMKGNLLLNSSETLPLVQAYMEKLNKKHTGMFTLLRVVNVEKRANGTHSSHYLLELEVKDLNGQLLRLSRYIGTRRKPTLSVKRANKSVLCNPVGLDWIPDSTVHIIVAVKNQGRWVNHLISEMEKLFRITGDPNLNLIIIDFGSTDTDVETALQSSTIPMYRYKGLRGNFQRAAGLQEGINLVQDKHSIIFLFDLHMEFPHSIIDTIRKHTVEGHMVFAPIIMRLDCGSTPQEARGFWEVNGFGLLGIYKSDLDAVGGMNTKEYTDRWGGEDWELIDRWVHFCTT